MKICWGPLSPSLGDFRSLPDASPSIATMQLSYWRLGEAANWMVWSEPMSHLLVEKPATLLINFWKTWAIYSKSICTEDIFTLDSNSKYMFVSAVLHFSSVFCICKKCSKVLHVRNWLFICKNVKALTARIVASWNSEVALRVSFWKPGVVSELATGGGGLHLWFYLTLCYSTWLDGNEEYDDEEEEDDDSDIFLISIISALRQLSLLWVPEHKRYHVRGYNQKAI